MACLSTNLGWRRLLQVTASVILLTVSFIHPGLAEADLCISKNGKPEAFIQISPDAGDIIKFAAEELKYYMDKTTGGNFEIVTEPPAGSKQDRIILGDTPESRAAGLDISKLSPDGFYIQTKDNTLFLAGKDANTAKRTELMRYVYTQFDRGTLRAVYHFLQNYMGVRWVFPGGKGEYIPVNKNISVPDISFKEEPFMKMRIIPGAAKNAKDLVAIYGDKGPQEWDLWLLRLGYSNWVMAKSHYFSYEYSASRWIENHPEYFAVNELGKRDTKRTVGGWKMCYSNPNLAREVAKDAIAYFSGQPASTRDLPEAQFSHFGYKRESFAINPSDADIACHCEECSKYRDEDGDYGELVWLYYKRVADEVAKYFPDKIISTWSYANHKEIPKSMKNAPENTRTYIITLGPLAWQKDDPRKSDAVERMKAWKKFANNHKLYEWVNMQVRATRQNILAGVPSPLPRTMASWMKDIAPYIDGVYLCNNDPQSSIFEASNTYVFYKLAWNPELDAEKLLSDYYSSAYGPAGAIIRKIEERFENIWFEKFFGPRTDMGIRFLGGKNTLPTTAEIWEDIFNDDVTARFKKEMARAVAAAKGTQFAERVGIFEKYYMGSFLEQKEKYKIALSMTEDMTMAAVKIDSKIAVDGKMNEESWKNAKPADMVSIKEGEKPKVKTLVRVLYDDKNLYIFFECEEPEISRLRTVATAEKLSLLWRDDEVEIFLDPEGERKNFFQILVNAAGVIQDIRRTGGLADSNWASGAKSATGRYDKGWTVEMAIPLSSLGVTAPDTKAFWVANFCRGRALINPEPGENQFLSWSRFVKDSFVQPQNFGRIFFADDETGHMKNENIIENGDFSDKLKAWGGRQSFIDKEERFLKEQSVRLQNTKEDPSTAIIYRFPKGVVKPNTPYVFSFYMRTENVVPLSGFEDKRYAGAMGEIFISGRGARFTPEISLRGSQPWRKYVMRIKTEATVPENASVRLRLHSATGKVWIENVVLAEENK